MIKQLHNLHKSLVLQWVPAHCGIVGNEMADQLAKKGCTLIQNLITDKPFISVKSNIQEQYRQKFIDRMKESAKDKSWEYLLQNPNFIPEEPRNSAVATFYLLTGHDCLAKHLHRIDILPSHYCVLCGMDFHMDKDNLVVCEALPPNQIIIGKY